jgi:alpha-tubulin suppressor-like RCC1 family protein
MHTEVYSARLVCWSTVGHSSAGLRHRLMHDQLPDRRLRPVTGMAHVRRLCDGDIAVLRRNVRERTMKRILGLFLAESRTLLPRQATVLMARSRRRRRLLLLPGLLLVAAALLGVHPAAASAATGREALHWGKLFGDKIGRNGDELLSPTRVSLPGRSPITQIATSNSTDYALLSDGTLWAWGQGDRGELGNGGHANSFREAVRVKFPAGVRIASIPTDVMPFDTGLAVDTEGNAWGWGLNERGELCLGKGALQPVPVKLPLTHVTALAGAWNHAVYDSKGTVYSCGDGARGVLGDGKTKASEVPVRVRGLTGLTVTSLVSSGGNAGALTSTGRVYDWGLNTSGQLGTGIRSSYSDVPVRVRIRGHSPVTDYVQGGSNPANGQSLVMLADGSLYAWGNDTWSQLGDGGTTSRPSPERIRPRSGVTYRALASGGATSYAIDTKGNVWAWGQDNFGQVGNGKRAKSVVTPVRVASGAIMISSTAENAAIAAAP